MLRLPIYLLVLACLAAPAAEPEDRVTAAVRDPALAVSTLIDISGRLGELEAARAVAVADQLDLLAARVFRSDAAVADGDRLLVGEHTVAAGELPGRILKRYHLSNAALELLNPAYDDTRLRVGQRLKVVDFSRVARLVLVQRSAYRCWVLGRFPGVEHPVLVAAFKVGVGAEESPTPLGASRIGVKARNMEWTHPDTGEVIPPGDPRNILGGYWMAIEDGTDGTFDGIGFHGYTGAPSDDWLERSDSHGCLRLLQDDIHALYALVPSGTRVLIRE